VDLLWDTHTPNGTVAHPNAPIELDLYFRFCGVAAGEAG
jgi:hypothetical protein